MEREGERGREREGGEREDEMRKQIVSLFFIVCVCVCVFWHPFVSKRRSKYESWW